MTSKEEMIEDLLDGIKTIIESQDSDTVKIERMKRSERLLTVAGFLTTFGLLAAYAIWATVHPPLCTQTFIAGVESAVCR